MARRSGTFSQAWIWFALFLSLSAGIAVSTWQSNVQTARERFWALKTVVVEEATPDVEVAATRTDPQPLELPAEDSAVVSTTPSIAESSTGAASEGVLQEEIVEPIAPMRQPLLPPVAGVEPENDEMVVAETAKSTGPREETFHVAESKAANREHSNTERSNREFSNTEQSIARLPTDRDDQKMEPSDTATPKFAPESGAKNSCIARPKALLADIELLGPSAAFSNFALRVGLELENLAGQTAMDSRKVGSILERLESLRLLGLELAQEHSHDPALPTALRVVHGLSRRIEIWNSLVGRGPMLVSTGVDAEPIRMTAQRLREELGKSQNSIALNWSRYLLLDELQSAQQGPTLSIEEVECIRRIAVRAESDGLSEAQRAFLKSGQPRDLLTVIEMYLLDAPTSRELLAEIEEYESEPSQERADRIALALGRLSLSPAAEDALLVRKLSQFYRAANVRVAISGTLINELIPTPEDSQEAVNDQLMGASITGRSNVSTRLRVHLVPDETRWRVGLEAVGNVSSHTQAFRGPFTFFNQGWANYQARTTVGLGREGFQMMNPPTAEASSQTDLLDLQSDFDGIPLIGLLARSVARQKLAQSQMEAEWEVEGRMARRIEQKLDTELQSRIRQAEREWASRIAQPLEGLRLGPTPVAMETTQERLIARYRIAGAAQLAAHTARPLAPSDSVLSVQLHVSAINNFIEQLGLDGKTFKLEELFLHLSKAMGQTNVEIPEEMPTNIHVRFADHDSLRLDVVNGEALLTVRLAEIRQGKSKWKNVQVRGHFAPKINGLNAELERTSYVELKGDGLRRIGGGQVVLRIAFTSVLSRVSNLPLMHPKLSTHPKMQKYEIRQFVLEDGWIGLALGPKWSQAAASPPKQEHTETARRPKSPVIDSILRR